MQTKTIPIPKFLQSLFGAEQKFKTLIALCAIGLLSGVMFFIWSLQFLSFTQVLITSLLFIDIVGGVISLRTQATQKHYRHRSKQKNFIVFHSLYGAIILPFFFDLWADIVFLSIILLLSSYSLIPTTRHRTVFACLLFILFTIITFSVASLTPPLALWFTCLAVKLLFAFRP